MRAKDVLGASGEQWASEYLQECGMQVLERNWRCKDGEIDIVAAEGEVLVICEVKTRRGFAFGAPTESVTPAKLQRLHRLGHRYRAEHGMAWRPLRVDVVGIVVSPGTPRELEHIRGAG